MPHSFDVLPDIVSERRLYLLQEQYRISQTLKKAPPGRLRINCVNGHPQYYHRDSPSSRNGTYISRKNSALAARLAQKEYDEKLADAVSAELKAIESFERLYPSLPAEKVYSSLPEHKKPLVLPVEEPLDQYIERWLAESYEAKEISDDIPELITEKGERVRSKSELLISSILNKEKIPYHYEHPLYLDNFGIIYPDFTVLNTRNRQETIWEHMGMMDDPDYAEKAIRKISAYIANGYYPGDRLILTFETRNIPINIPQIQALVRHHFL